MARLPRNVVQFLPHVPLYSGTSIVFLPGYGASVSEPWHDFAQALTDRHQAPVYLILHNTTQPIGREQVSPLPGKNQSWKFQQALQAIELLNLREFHLIGYSEGAMHAVHLANRFITDRIRQVKSLSLINPPVTGKESLLKIAVRAVISGWHRTMAGWTADAAAKERLRQHSAGVKIYTQAYGTAKALLHDAVVPGQIDLGPVIIELALNGLPIKLLPSQGDAMITCSKVKWKFSPYPEVEIQELPGPHCQIFLTPKMVAEMV